MGPITLFDKSFLQSLKLDESVWFDQFFLTNVCPLFYVETLADLEKIGGKRRTAEQEVGIIADKFPQMNGTPSANHLDLCLDNLLGHEVPMTGQIVIADARLVMVDGKPNALSERSPETDAFLRWQDRDFFEIERLYARVWRQALASLNLKEIADSVKALGIKERSCKTLEDAQLLSEEIISRRSKPVEQITLALALLKIPLKYHRQIVERWALEKSPALEDYAPYAAFVLKLEIFFHIALAAGLISPQRPSNRVDIAYLFYLPFCMLFVSSDNLHRQCAPLFLRKNQEFLWGADLKKSLGQLDAFYQNFPDSEKDRGVMVFASTPPQDESFLVTQLWDRHLPKWRESTANPSRDASKFKDIVEKVKMMEHSPSMHADVANFHSSAIESATMKRTVRRKKGSWYQIPKKIP